MITNVYPNALDEHEAYQIASLAVHLHDAFGNAAVGKAYEILNDSRKIVAKKRQERNDALAKTRLDETK